MIKFIQRKIETNLEFILVCALPIGAVLGAVAKTLVA